MMHPRNFRIFSSLVTFKCYNVQIRQAMLNFDQCILLRLVAQVMHLTSACPYQVSVPG